MCAPLEYIKYRALCREIYNKSPVDCADSRIINLHLRIFVINFEELTQPNLILEIDFMEIISHHLIPNDAIFFDECIIIKEVLIQILNNQRVNRGHDIENGSG
jgi:hypothetical protein